MASQALTTQAVAQQSANAVSLDAGDQRLAAWQLDDVTSFNNAHAAVTIKRLDPEGGGAITPSIMFNLVNNDEKATVYIAADSDGRHLDVLVQHYKDGQLAKDDGGSFVTAMDLEIGKSFDLALDWTAANKLTVKLNGAEAVSTPLSGAPRSMQLNATGSAIDLKPLELAHS